MSIPSDRTEREMTDATELLHQVAERVITPAAREEWISGFWTFSVARRASCLEAFARLQEGDAEAEYRIAAGELAAVGIPPGRSEALHYRESVEYQTTQDRWARSHRRLEEARRLRRAITSVVTLLRP